MLDKDVFYINVSSASGSQCHRFLKVLNNVIDEEDCRLHK